MPRSDLLEQIGIFESVVDHQFTAVEEADGVRKVAHTLGDPERYASQVCPDFGLLELNL